MTIKRKLKVGIAWFLRGLFYLFIASVLALFMWILVVNPKMILVLLGSILGTLIFARLFAFVDDTLGNP